MEKELKFVEPSQEEKETFMKEFDELAKKHNLYVEAIPQFVRDGGESKEFKVTTTLFLQKGVEKEDETTKEN